VGKFLAEAVAEAAGEGYVECAEALGMMREELDVLGIGAAAGGGVLDRVDLVQGIVVQRKLRRTWMPPGRSSSFQLQMRVASRKNMINAMSPIGNPNQYGSRPPLS
jgi:hypothetical protein